MPNDYFRFKQFRVLQDKTAMKVCTDSCLFGAWVAEKIQTGMLRPENILDIGTGTGLLSLMLAQKCTAQITAVEIDEQAAQQATGNFETSPWPVKLQVINGDIRELSFPAKFDLVISNPPFYENNLKSEDTKRNIALHSQALNLEELLAATSKTLQITGSLAVMLPYKKAKIFTNAALKFDLHLHEQMLIKQTDKHPFFRAMLLLSKGEAPLKESQTIIKHQDGYQPEFKALLKDYYLFF